MDSNASTKPDYPPVIRERPAAQGPTYAAMPTNRFRTERPRHPATPPPPAAAGFGFLVASCLIAASWPLGGSPADAAEVRHVSVDGSPDNSGSPESPWDIESTWAGRQSIAPGTTIVMLPGTYRHPDRRWESKGFEIALAGTADAPIHIRPAEGERVTIDGRVEVTTACRHLWLWDIEITVSETARWNRRVGPGGHEPEGAAALPAGGLNILGGSGGGFVNLVIHDMANGVGLWSTAVDVVFHGCLIHGIGSVGPDRYHGPGIYTQNREGTKEVSDNILFANHSTTIQAYGSANAWVDGFRIRGNIAFAPMKEGARERILVGGGRPSRDIVVEDNILHEVPLQIGYTATDSEDAVVRNNRVVNAGLQIQGFRRVEETGNLVLPPDAPRPDRSSDTVLRVNRFTPDRANLAVFNWRRAREIEVDLSGFLAPGDGFRIVSALDFYGPPVAAGTFAGTAVALPIPADPRTGGGEFSAFVVLRTNR